MNDSAAEARSLRASHTTALVLRSLTLLLVRCAGASAQSVPADDPNRLAAIRAACAEGAQKLCAGVQPGGGRIVACLKEHKDSLSDRCRKAAGLPANPSSSSPASSTPSTSSASGSQPAGTTTTPAAKSSAAAATGTKAPSQSGSAPGSYLRMKQVQVIAHVSDPSLGGK